MTLLDRITHGTGGRHQLPLLERHESVRAASDVLSRPFRQTALPVLVGRGKGLRIRTGPSTMTRLVATIEGDVEDAFLRLLKPGMTVFDIGASIGWFSLLAARAVTPSGRVVAFEPSVGYASLAQANARSNGLTNVRVVAAAVADRDGWASFGAGTTLQGRLSSRGEDCVPVLALDDWLAVTGETAPDIVKIDVEGGEVAVLRGMARTLQTRRPTLIVELHHTAHGVAAMLDELGYRHRPLEVEGLTRDAPWWAHVVATPA